MAAAAAEWGTWDGSLRPFVWEWRRALLRPDGPPATRRYVLLALSLHADAAGESCFPSVRLLAEETGLSRRVVMNHITQAVREGWIRRHSRGRGGRGWRRAGYALTIPPNLVTEGDHPHDVVTLDDHLATRGGYSCDTDVVTQGDLSMPEECEEPGEEVQSRVRVRAREGADMVHSATPAPQFDRALRPQPGAVHEVRI